MIQDLGLPRRVLGHKARFRTNHYSDLWKYGVEPERGRIRRLPKYVGVGLVVLLYGMDAMLLLQEDLHIRSPKIICARFSKGRQGRPCLIMLQNTSQPVASHIYSPVGPLLRLPVLPLQHLYSAFTHFHQVVIWSDNRSSHLGSFRDRISVYLI